MVFFIGLACAASRAVLRIREPHEFAAMDHGSEHVGRQGGDLAEELDELPASEEAVARLVDESPHEPAENLAGQRILPIRRAEIVHDFFNVLDVMRPVLVLQRAAFPHVVSAELRDGTLLYLRQEEEIGEVVDSDTNDYQGRFPLLLLKIDAY